MQIRLCKAQIIVGNFTKLQGSLLYGCLSCRNLFQKSLKFSFIFYQWFLSSDIPFLMSVPFI